jgi:hypothetical protein
MSGRLPGQWPGLLPALLLALALPGWAADTDFAAQCADRTAVERVYYNHRLGDKPPFEETLPPALVKSLVEESLRKEAVLEKVYGVKITAGLLEAEVRRINSTTRAPDVLAELKAALDNDPERFARTVAKPILVERLLRDKFENDDALHAPQRRQAERIRTELLAAKANHAGADKLLTRLKQLGSNLVTETTWQLGKPPEPPQDDGKELMEVRKRFGPQAQLLSSPQATGGEHKFYFEDLPAELQRVLRVQLRQSGDVSAVIETPRGFLVYVCQAKDSTAISVAALSVPKRSYEKWLTEQSEAGR